ncbi:MAG TPA: hypothetical protein VHM20_06920 [Gammaproteobacteria bacterium]|nr:hypothetical protein [Gammaproteobacteria bacterium]
MKKTTTTIYHEYHTESEPLTVNDTAGPIVTRKATITPGGSMTTAVIGKDSTPEDVQRVVDALLKTNKHDRQSNALLFNANHKDSKPIQQKISKKRKFFEDPSPEVSPSESPRVYSGNNVADSHVSISVSADASEEAQLAIIRALFSRS